MTAGFGLLRSVPALPENVAALRQAVSELARRAGASERVGADVALAVSEACGNVVMHAYPPGETGPLIVEAAVADGMLRVSVSDHGGGMAPRIDSTGLGLGLPLMTTLAHDLVITPADGGIGTRLRMTFALAG